MTEFEINDNGDLVIVCDHDWSPWVKGWSNDFVTSREIRYCHRCGAKSILVPTNS